MAKNKNDQMVDPSVPVGMTTSEKKDKREMWRTAGWMLLLLGGLAHMLPSNMGPLLQLGVSGVTVQTVVGIASVVVALNFLLKD